MNVNVDHCPCCAHDAPCTRCRIERTMVWPNRGPQREEGGELVDVCTVHRVEVR